MAVKEQLDDVSKSLKGILDQMKGVGEQYKKIEASSKTYASNISDSQKALEKVLKTLKDIGAEQDKIAKGGSGLGGALSGVRSSGSRTGANPSSFSTPVVGADGASLLNAGRATPSVATIAGMPAMAFGAGMLGSPLGIPIPTFGGVPFPGMSTGPLGALDAAAAYGVGTPGGGMPSGPSGPNASKWVRGLTRVGRFAMGAGKFALGTGAIGAGMTWNMTPNAEDIMTYNGSILPVATFSTGTYNRGAAERRMRANFGKFQSSENSINMSGSMLTMGGFNGQRFDQIQREAATAFMVSGMDNAAATQGLMGLRSPQTSNSLASIGIFVSDLNTGNDLGINSVVDQIWNRWSGGRAMTYQDVQNSIRGGYLGAGLRRYFGDNPQLYSMIVDRLLLKARNNGTPLANKDEKWMQAQYAKMGITDKTGPQFPQGNLSASRNYVLGSASGVMTDSIVGGVNNVAGMNYSIGDLAQSNPAMQGFLAAKGGIQGFTGTTEGAAVSNALAQEINLIVGLLGQFGGAIASVLTAMGIRAVSKMGSKGTTPEVSPDAAERRTGGTRDATPKRTLPENRVTTARAAAVSAGDNPYEGPAVRPPAGRPSGFLPGTSTVGDLAGGAAVTIAAAGLDMLYMAQGPEGPIKDWWARNFHGSGPPEDRGDRLVLPNPSNWGMFQPPWMRNITLDKDPTKYEQNIQALLEWGIRQDIDMDPAADGVQPMTRDAAVAMLNYYKFPMGTSSSKGAGGSGMSAKSTKGANRTGLRDADSASAWAVGQADSPDKSYQGLCDHFVARAYGLAHSGYENARQHLAAVEQAGLLHAGDTRPPVGASVYWDSGPDGHIAIVTGYDDRGPLVASNDVRRSGKIDVVPLSEVTKWLGGNYKGWSQPYYQGRVGSVGSVWKSAQSNNKEPGAAAQSNVVYASYTAGSSALSNILSNTPNVLDALLGKSSGTSGATSARSLDLPQSSSGPESVPMGRSGSGPVWLAKFLYNKGVRGDNLRSLWALGMRESSGRPGVDNAGLNRDGSTDYGIWQINSVHEPWLQKTFGWSMEDMRDPDKNFRAMWRMSQHGANLKSWNIGPEGYDPANQSKHTAAYEKWMSDFDKYAAKAGVPTHQDGLVRVNGDQNVRVHDGEMILPALAANEFRRVLQESLTSTPRNAAPISITLKIEKASDEEAIRFAKKVKSLIEDDSRMRKVRSH